MEDQAKAAYEAWLLDRAWMELPLWKDLPRDVKELWDAATQAAMSSRHPGEGSGSDG